MAGPLMLKVAAACCFYHVDIFCSVCDVMMRILTFDGNIPILELTAAGKLQSPWQLKRFK